MLKKTLINILILTFCFQNYLVLGQSQTDRGIELQMKNERTGNFETVTLYKKSYALVIGESKYKFTSAWKELEGVRQDVQAITRLLREQGFDEVIVAQDLTRFQLDQTIRGFISKYGLARENRLLIYYAGHGYTETTEDGLKLGYLVPIDAPSPVKQPDVFYETAMSMNDIESYALSIRSKHVLFVFDSCFSGTILRKTRATVPPIITLKAAQPVRQFITSGAEDQEVPDVSEFRKQFEEGLRGEADLNNDGYVTGSELGDFLQEKVTNYSKGSQTPLTGKIANGALDKGDFIFTLKKISTFQPTINSTNNGEADKLILTTINKGVLNGAATYLPEPVYPSEAISLGIFGKVEVHINLDLEGKVVYAEARTGAIELYKAAESAALLATFKPTLLSGQKVKVSGILVYNFVSSKPDKNYSINGTTDTLTRNLEYERKYKIKGRIDVINDNELMLFDATDNYTLVILPNTANEKTTDKFMTLRLGNIITVEGRGGYKGELVVEEIEIISK